MEAFAPTVPHFFKVMLDEDIKTGKLFIPKKFARKYGANLRKSGLVVLRVQTGDSWEVELRTSDGVVRLEKGWPEFLNFYDIGHGDFLQFRYESGRSNKLDVVVCDRTCTEVEYPKRSRVDMPCLKVEDVGEDDVIAEEETRERQPSRRTATKKTCRSKLKRGSKGRGEGKTGLKVGTEDEEGDGNGFIEVNRGGPEEGEEERKGAAVRSPARVGRPPPSTMKPKRNPYFVKSLTKLDVMKFMTLPRGVATEAGQWTKESSLIRGSGGREWPVAIRVRNCPAYRRVDFSTGWLNFARGTGLSPGDTVRFEFLGGRNNLIEAQVLS